MKTAFIHIGTHKTGTTFLQQWLHRHLKQMQDAGIYVPETGRMRKEAQHKHLSAPIREWLPESDVPDIWQRLGAEIRDRPEDILLSAEHFTRSMLATNRANRLMAYLESLGYRVVLILFLRDQVSYMNSRYCQEAKRFITVGPFEAYLNRWQNNVIFNYDRMTARLERLNAELRVFPFPPRDQTIQSVLVETLGITPFAEQPVARANESMGPKTIFAARLFANRTRLNRRLKKRGPGERQRRLDELRRLTAPMRKSNFELGWNRDKFMGFTPETAEAARIRFAAGNDEVALRYWGMTWAEMHDSITPVSNEIDLESPDPAVLAEVLEFIEPLLPKAERIISAEGAIS